MTKLFIGLNSLFLFQLLALDIDIVIKIISAIVTIGLSIYGFFDNKKQKKKDLERDALIIELYNKIEKKESKESLNK